MEDFLLAGSIENIAFRALDMGSASLQTLLMRPAASRPFTLKGNSSVSLFFVNASHSDKVAKNGSTMPHSNEISLHQTPISIRLDTIVLD